MLRPLPPAKALEVLKRKWERHFDKQVSITTHCCSMLYSPWLRVALVSLWLDQTLASKLMFHTCVCVMQTSGGQEPKVAGAEPITQECPVSCAATNRMPARQT